jgi:hypothetical protein
MARLSFIIELGDDLSSERIDAIIHMVLKSLSGRVRRGDHPVVELVRADDIPVRTPAEPSENRGEKPRACSCSDLHVQRTEKFDRSVASGKHMSGCPMWEFDPDEIPF